MPAQGRSFRVLAPVREEALVSVRSRAEGTLVLSTTLRISKGSYGSNSRSLLRICGWGRGPLWRLRWSGGWTMVKVPLPSPACAREVLCAAAGSLVAVLAPCSCPSPLSALALFPPPRLGRYVVLHFHPPARFHICGHGLLRRYQPCAGRSLVFFSFLFSVRARQNKDSAAVLYLKDVRIPLPPPPPRRTDCSKFEIENLTNFGE